MSPAPAPAADVLPLLDLDYEYAVLGAFILERQAQEFISRLRPMDFGDLKHQVLFARMEAMHAAGVPIDVVTVARALREAGELDAAGGPAHLALLMEQASIAVHLEHYIGELIELSAKRHLVVVAKDLAAGAVNGRRYHDLVARAMTTFEELSERHARAVSAEPKVLIGPALLRGTQQGADWVVDGLFSHRNQHMIVGASQGAKTFTLLGFGVAVSHTDVSTFLGQPIARHGRVVIESWEQGQAEDIRKLRKLLRGHALSTCSDDLILISEPPAALGDPSYFQRRLRELREWRATAYLIDSLSEAAGTDLNDNAAYSQWWRARVKPILDLDCMVAFTHLKGHVKPGVGQNRDSASRGATQIRALSTGVIEMRQLNDRLFKVAHNKHRDGTALPLGLLELEGEMTDDFVRLALKPDDSGQGSKDGLARRLLVQLGNAHPEGHLFDRKAIEAALNAKDRPKDERCSKKIWEEVIARMVEEGLFEAAKRGNATVWRWTFEATGDDDVPF